MQGHGPRQALESAVERLGRFAIAIGPALTDLGRAIEPRDEVRRNLVLGHVRSGTQIRHLEDRLGLVDLSSCHLVSSARPTANAQECDSRENDGKAEWGGTHEDVVRLQVGVHDLALAHEREREEHLTRVGAHGPQVETDIFAVPLDDLAQVHAVRGARDQCSFLTAEERGDEVRWEGKRGNVPERFKHEAEVTAVFERAEQPDDVLLVVRVGVPQLAQNLRLFQPGFVPVPFGEKGAHSLRSASF